MDDFSDDERADYHTPAAGTPTNSQSPTSSSVDQASAAFAAIEAAWARIRQLRRSLLELSERMPAPEPPSHAPPSASQPPIGPAHSALVLGDSSAGRVEASVRRSVDQLRASMSPDALARLEEFEARRAAGLTRARAIAPPTAPQPTVPRASDLPSRRWILENRISRRHDLTADDPATTRGRRVAERLEAGSSRAAQPSTVQREMNLFRRTDQIRRDIERLSRSLLDSGVENHNTNADIPTIPWTPAVPSRQERILRPSQSGGQRGLNLPPPSRRRTNDGQDLVASRTRPARTGVWPTLSDRLTMSNNSALGPTNPSRAIVTVSSPNTLAPSSRDDYDYDTDATEGGSSPFDGVSTPRPATSWQYYNRALESASQMPPLLFPRSSADDDEADDSFSVTRRRRGWARLNADGEEIPSDEEARYERLRARNRERAHSQGRLTNELAPRSGNGTAGQPPLSPSRWFPRDEDFSMTSQPILAPILDGEPPPTRVRIPPISTIWRPASDESLGGPSTPSSAPTLTPVLGLPSSGGPMVVDLLPMPVEDMTPHHRRSSAGSAKVIALRKHASLAGR